MIDAPTNGQGAELAEQALRDELARCDAAIATVRPVLRGLLANEDPALFSDEVVARVRGMMLDLAAQVLSVQATAARARDPASFVTSQQDDLAQAFSRSAGLLAQAHAQVLEVQLADRLRVRSALDPVLSPLLQQAVAGADPELAGLAMAVLTAQGRFMRQVDQMKLPLGELPADLFDEALAAGRGLGGAGVAEAEHVLRAAYDEVAGREALLARLAARSAEDGADPLTLDHAGLALFVSALAAASRQARARAITAFAESQLVRLVLSLRAAGLTQQAMELHLQLIHPQRSLPAGFETVPIDRAVALLSAGGSIEVSG